MPLKDDEWINIDLKVSREGKAYASVDPWVPDAAKAPQNACLRLWGR